jgi:predicted DNA-binding mobile mystery protein A
MKLKNSKLVIGQLDKKLQAFNALSETQPPTDGWIKTIRTTLNMSLRQLAERLSMTPQSIKEVEQREKDGTITLNKLQEAANALDMKLFYCFVPKDGSLEKMIERKAYEMATKIVKRTSTTMKLEDQENSDERLRQAIKEMAEEIKREMPKKLWD